MGGGITVTFVTVTGEGRKTVNVTCNFCNRGHRGDPYVFCSGLNFLKIKMTGGTLVVQFVGSTYT